MTLQQFKGTSSHAQDRAESLLELYRIGADDLARVRELGRAAATRMGDAIAKWYEWLETQPEFHQFFAEPETLERVAALQRAYWEDFLKAEVDDG